MVSRWTLVGDVRVHVRLPEAPPPPGAPTVVLVHGLVVSSRYMVPTARRLARFCRVLAPDLPGFGRSDKPERPLAITELADALEAWMRAEGLERAVLVGNSLGCQTLAHFAVRHPGRVQGLVLQGPTMDARARGGLRQLARWLRNSPREPLSESLVIFRDYVDAGPARALATYRAALRDRIEEQLPHIQAPVLVVRGGRDPIVPPDWAEEVVRLLPRGQLVVVPGGTHTLNWSAPLELVRVMEPFIRSVASGAGEQRA